MVKKWFYLPHQKGPITSWNRRPLKTLSSLAIGEDGFQLGLQHIGCKRFDYVI